MIQKQVGSSLTMISEWGVSVTPFPYNKGVTPIRGRGVGRQGGERRLSARGGATFAPAGGDIKNFSGGG